MRTLIVGMGILASGVAAAQTQMAAVIARGYSFGLGPATLSNGGTILFTTYDGSSGWPLGCSGGFCEANGEVSPAALGGGTYRTDYLAADASGIFEYGALTLAIPATDTDGNGMPDVLELERNGDFSVSGSGHCDWGPIFGCFSSSLSANVSRAAGTPDGTYSGTYQVPALGISIPFSGAFELVGAAGSGQYVFGGDTLDLTVSSMQLPYTYQASTTFSRIGTSGILLPPLTLTDPSAGREIRSASVTLNRTGNVYRGRLALQDGDPDTSWVDYADLLLEVTDTNDSNGDGIPDLSNVDPCADLGGDTDGDGACDSDDNCWDVPNPAQEDADGDGLGDACDDCPLDAMNDEDGDGRCADLDVCPGVSDPNQADSDLDGRGDACDPCPADSLDDYVDGDSVCMGSDNCAIFPNPLQEDTGGFDSSAPDGTGDACQCGDVSDDGRVDLLDVVLLERVLAGRGPRLEAPEKCRVAAQGGCDGLDLAALREALAGMPGGVTAVCQQSGPVHPFDSEAAQWSSFSGNASDELAIVAVGSGSLRFDSSGPGYVYRNDEGGLNWKHTVVEVQIFIPDLAPFDAYGIGLILSHEQSGGSSLPANWERWQVPPSDLVQGAWQTITFDLAKPSEYVAGSGADLGSIRYLGLQVVGTGAMVYFDDLRVAPQPAPGAIRYGFDGDAAAWTPQGGTLSNEFVTFTEGTGSLRYDTTTSGFIYRNDLDQVDWTAATVRLNLLIPDLTPFDPYGIGLILSHEQSGGSSLPPDWERWRIPRSGLIAGAWQTVTVELRREPEYTVGSGADLGSIQYLALQVVGGSKTIYFDDLRVAP